MSSAISSIMAWDVGKNSGTRKHRVTFLFANTINE